MPVGVSMSLDVNAPARLIIPEAHRKPVWPWFVAALLIVGAGYWAWRSGIHPSRLWAKRGADLSYVSIDQGDLDVFVTENGSLESGNNATVYCKVEALMGQVGGAQGATVGAGGMRTGGTAGPAGAGQAGGAQQGNQQAQPAPAKKATTKARGGAAKTATAGASKSATATNASADATATAAAGGGGAGGRGGGSGGGMAVTPSAAAATTTTAITRPMIQSFSMMVVRHTPLRPANKAGAQAQQKTQQMDPMGGGRGGRGGGRGGRGGGGAGNMMEEKPGATRIIWILPEGTRVKTGDKVCEFDASSFTTEVDAQQIRYNQAKSWVDQAKSMLEVSQMSLEEYRKGIYPKDKEQITHYILMCKTEAERTKRAFDWSKDIYNKGLRAKSQVTADGLAAQQAMISLNQAERMDERLEKYTRPKLIKSLEANVEAIRADLLSQEASFQLEADRLKRLKAMVENCTLRSPRDGIVVYVNQSNGWGSNEVQIQEGATVREGQPIFSVPDPRNMQVRAKINESKVALIHSGQPALIRVDAFANQPMRGTVGEVTAIPAPMNRMSDVKIYFATVTIVKGFDGLRPGLSAEVDFFCETRSNVTRIPLQAIRKVGGQSFAAVKLPRRPESGPPWKWVRIELGMSNASFAEVTSGLKPGDQVVGQPETLLPAPTPIASPVQTALNGA